MTTTHVLRKERTTGAATRLRLPRQRSGKSAVGFGLTAFGFFRSADPNAPSRLPWILGCVGSAIWAGTFPLVSDLGPQRAWGLIAALGYVAAACASAFLPRPKVARAATALAVLGAVVIPLGLMVAEGWAQSEVSVVQNSAVQLLHTGSPYLPDPHGIMGYNPYLPAMALFGLPRALLGDDGLLPQVVSDARIWFLVAFAACLVATWRLVRPQSDGAADDGAGATAGGTATGTAGRTPSAGGAGGVSWAVPLAAVTASPLVALVATTGGVDLPLIGFCCLGLALAGRGYAVRAGVVLALACAVKWTAWPALPVAVLLLLHLYGRRAALRCTAATLALAAALIAPGAILTPHAVMDQVIRFPLGMASMRTPADSPLPGHLLAELGPSGRVASLTLLALGGVAVALWLLIRPPLDVTQAADRLAVGVGVAFLLAPAGRFGYLELPVLLVLWPRLATHVPSADVDVDMDVDADVEAVAVPVPEPAAEP
ncbi:glycosyltransferase 87 family protein [Streptacidiphilus sp. MAP12-16]|uniref:glycosyltransferase 87 family protein n=1 Tax=Streptacidiphilus sp. MAP12-16 TaxID=3156300 RepID=UPI0035196823